MNAKRTKQETIEYFKHLSESYLKDAKRAENETEKECAYAKSEAYELAAFELERNME